LRASNGYIKGGNGEAPEVSLRFLPSVEMTVDTTYRRGGGSGNGEAPELSLRFLPSVEMTGCATDRREGGSGKGVCVSAPTLYTPNAAAVIPNVERNLLFIPKSSSSSFV
jgi:hypothetical protein